MYVAEVAFKFQDGHEPDAVIEGINGLLHALRQNGQIAGREFPLAQQEDTYLVYLMLPAADSLAESHRGQWVVLAYERLEELNLQEITLRLVGEDPDSREGCSCARRESLILYTTYVSLESCLRCGDCFSPVPLYTVPPTYDGEFYDVFGWENDYKACDQLQMNCRTGERFGLRELGRPDSSLTQRGRTLTQKLEASTGIPVFYFLYRYYGKSARFERERLCPVCKGAWRLEERLHGRFDFQCYGCRLLSNLADNSAE